MITNEAAALEPDKILCPKCRRLLKSDQFYLRRDGSHLDLCKPCVTMHVDNFDPETFTWILKDLDMPYIPSEWNVLRDRAYAKDVKKMNGLSVIGKYVAKMRLKKWKQYTWNDTDLLIEREERQQEELQAQKAAYQQQLKEDLANGDISEAQYKTMMDTETQWEEHLTEETYDPVSGPSNTNMYNEEEFLSPADIPDPTQQLTTDDKVYLALKWGRLYKPEEWLELEKSYVEYSKAADMSDPDTSKTLILLSKTYLKMNQAIDCGDVDGYQKLSKVYDSMRKSLNLTAVQNKEEKSDIVDCIGNLIVYCEEHGGRIPRYNLDVNYDILDKEIKNMKRYNRVLVEQDPALSRQIEDYIKERRIAEEMKRDRERAQAQNLDAIEITDADIAAHKDSIAQQIEEDSRRQSGIWH